MADLVAKQSNILVLELGRQKVQQLRIFSLKLMAQEALLVIIGLKRVIKNLIEDLFDLLLAHLLRHLLLLLILCPLLFD